MKVIVFLDDTAAPAVQAAGRKALEKRGLKLGTARPELASLGVVAGELPEHEFLRIEKECAAGQLPGVSSIERDGSQAAPRQT